MCALRQRLPSFLLRTLHTTGSVLTLCLISQDMALSAEYMVEHGTVTDSQRAELLSLVDMLYSQGVDWEGWFETFTGDAGGHNVSLPTSRAG